MSARAIKKLRDKRDQVVATIATVALQLARTWYTLEPEEQQALISRLQTLGERHAALQATLEVLNEPEET